MPREKCLLSCDTAAAVVGELSEEEWGVGCGEGSSDSCFPSALSQLQSAGRNLTGPEQQSAAQRSVGGGPKIPSIRRSSQFVCPYPRRSSASQTLLSGVMCKSRTQKLAVLTAIWEQLCLFLIVFHPFTLFCVGAQLSWLVQVLAPHLTPRPPHTPLVI